MAVARKKRNIRRTVLGLAASLLSLAALFFIAPSLLSGGLTDGSLITRILSLRGNSGYAEEYNFDTGRNRVFADLDGGFLSAGTLGIQVLGNDGNETLRDTFQTTAPALDAVGGRAVVFDVGGSALRLLDKTRILVSLETEGSIVSASLNKNGWFCVSTLENSTYKSAALVYNSKGNAVYKANFSSGYALDTALSNDNKNLSVLTLTESGSRITLYSLSNEEPLAYFNLDGGLIIDIRYLPDGRLLAVGKDSVYLIEKDGEGEALYEFPGKSLRGYALEDNLLAMYLLDFGVGNQGRLVALNLKGDNPAVEHELARELIGVSVYDKTVAVLWSEGLSFYDAELNDTGLFGKTAGGYSFLVALDGGAFVSGEYSAAYIPASDAAEYG